MKKYNKTIEQLISKKDELFEEMSLFQQTQTSLLRNDYYQIKDRDTQAVFESILKINQAKEPSNNHQKEYDLKYDGEKISIKSGTFKNDCIQFSYSRTTAFTTLEEKLNYLSSFDNLILGLASEQNKSNNEDISCKTNYYLYYFCANEINLKTMDWNESDSGWLGIDKTNNIRVEIKRKLSDQPWITIPSKLINCASIMNTMVINRNSKKYLMIEDTDRIDRTYYDIYNFRKKVKSLKGISECKKSTIKNVMA